MGRSLVANPQPFNIFIKKMLAIHFAFTIFKYYLFINMTKNGPVVLGIESPPVENHSLGPFFHWRGCSYHHHLSNSVFFFLFKDGVMGIRDAAHNECGPWAQ